MPIFGIKLALSNVNHGRRSMSELASHNLYQIMRTYGDADAVIDTQGALSYRHVITQAESITAKLISLGIQSGSIVAVTLKTHRDFLPTVLGILGARAIVLPIAPTIAHDVHAATMTSMGASSLISNDIASNGKTSELGEGIYLHQLHTPGDSYVTNTFPDAAIIRHTSGTTGTPKGVVLSHKAVIERTQTSATLLGTAPRDIIVSPVPLSYHFIASALTFLRSGATIIETVGRTVDDILELAEKHQATIIYGEPRFYDQSVLSKRAHTIASLRSVLSTSSSLHPKTAQTFEALFGKRLTQVYGIIEVGLPIWNTHSSDQAACLGTCLTPYSYQLSPLVNTEKDTTGELYLKGPGLFSGYVYSRDHLEPAPLIDGTWFPTGDIVTRDSKGSMTFRGRKKSLLQMDETVVFPEEIEQVILQHPDVQAVRVGTDQVQPKRLIAEISTDTSESMNIASVQKLCEDSLPTHLVPSAFRLVQSLPTTGSGKIRRVSST